MKRWTVTCDCGKEHTFDADTLPVLVMTGDALLDTAGITWLVTCGCGKRQLTRAEDLDARTERFIRRAVKMRGAGTPAGTF